MTTAQTLWAGIGAILLVLIMVAWLKGAFGLAAAAIRKLAQELGEPWTLAAALEPFLVPVAVFATAAFGLAHPDSLWARWFYGEHRLAKARASWQ